MYRGKEHLDHEILGLLEEIQALVKMKNEKEKVESENVDKLPVNQMRLERL